MCPHALQRDAADHHGAWRCDDPALSLELLARGDGALAVRPPGQPLPPHLRADGVLGGLFGRWLRQRDDAARAAPKAALTQALAALAPDELRAHARRQALLARRAGDWNHWAWAVPAAGIASLLGLPMDEPAAQQRLHAQLRAIARGLTGAPGVDAADAAAGALLQALRQADPEAPLQRALARHAPAALWPDAADLEANRLALLWQSHEAGAALLANALARLAEEPASRRPGAMPGWLPALVDAGGAVRNTRRFAQRALQIGASRLQPGDGLLLNLVGGGAGFGAGVHRCPGQDLALQMVAAALEQLLEDPPLSWPQRLPAQDLVLPNARIPCFATPEPLP